MKLLGWISEGLGFDEPDTFYMASRFAYAPTALGEFGYATSLGKIMMNSEFSRATNQSQSAHLCISQFQRALFVRFVVRSSS